MSHTLILSDNPYTCIKQANPVGNDTKGQPLNYGQKYSITPVGTKDFYRVKTEDGRGCRMCSARGIQKYFDTMEHF